MEPKRLDRALETLHHRGPDSVGRWISSDRRWFLGHTRLAIIGLNNGDQPIANAAGDVRIVVNGELYGYRVIRDRLRAEGCPFKTESDSEIALHLYLREGMTLGRHLRGEFAAVIADRRNGAMLAIRDRFGIKPLFYTAHEGNVYFASEVKALLALGVPARWNREAVLEECFHFRPHSHSIFDGIYTVPPGHYAIAQRGEVSVYPYWDLVFPTAAEIAADDRTDAEVVAGFRDVLDDAVRERLIADVEVASYLSGGIDSCSVLGLAQLHMDRPIRAFTLCFEDAAYDESEFARAGRALGLELPPGARAPARPRRGVFRRGLARGDTVRKRPRRGEVPPLARGSRRGHQGRVHGRGVRRDARGLCAVPARRPPLQQRQPGPRDRREAARRDAGVELEPRRADAGADRGRAHP